MPALWVGILCFTLPDIFLIRWLAYGSPLLAGSPELETQGQFFLIKAQK